MRNNLNIDLLSNSSLNSLILNKNKNVLQTNWLFDTKNYNSCDVGLLPLVHLQELMEKYNREIVIQHGGTNVIKSSIIDSNKKLKSFIDVIVIDILFLSYLFFD
jgi:hypothetical protein